MRIAAVLETCLYAEDLEAAKEFYTGLFELPIIEYVPTRHLFLKLEASVLLIFNPRETATHQSTVNGQPIPMHGAQGAGHLAFRVAIAELPGWRSRLQVSGVAIESEILWPSGGRSIYFRDPAGNSLELGTPELWNLA